MMYNKSQNNALYTSLKGRHVILSQCLKLHEFGYKQNKICLQKTTSKQLLHT